MKMNEEFAINTPLIRMLERARALMNSPHWFQLPRMPGLHHHLRGALSESCSRVVCFLLPQLPHSSVARQRRAQLRRQPSAEGKVVEIREVVGQHRHHERRAA
jgi:hypothetical protein